MTMFPLETLGEESEIRFRDCFSVRYLQSAALLCRLGYSIEKDYEPSGVLPPDTAVMHEAFILNSILSSVAFLESTINELYSDAADNVSLSPHEETGALFRLISARWTNERNFDRAPLLTKYQKILAIAGREPFSETDPAFTNVKNIIEIRNFLLHYRREWIVIPGGRGDRTRKGAHGDRFEGTLKHAFKENPFAPGNRPFFPDRCLGHGFAEWAVINSLIVTDEFFSRLGLAMPYDGIRKGLVTR